MTLKRLLTVAVSAFLLLHSQLAFSAGSEPNPSGFAIKRGVNLSHWLSQDFGWVPREEWITRNDIRYIASIGFDHVRLPIDEKEMWHEDGSPNEEAFALLTDALGWCSEEGLRVIVDLHTVRAHHFNAVNEGLKNSLWTDPAAQEQFFDLWSQLSERLSSYPVSEVAYEIMNEPVADDHEDWNRLVAKSLERIRAQEPDRVVVIGSNLWQIPETLGALKVPAGDKNIILSTHVYSPFVFTHYTAEWTPLKDYRGEVNYPGKVLADEEYERLMKLNGGSLSDLVKDSNLEWGKEQMKAKFQAAVDRAEELGLQLYCGEFGCLPTVPREGRLQYYEDITAAMEELGMAWANWEYKGDFGIFEWHSESMNIGAPDLEMIHRLVGD
ncbi:glycoside hydrolase family 5 protein [Pelagicoccus albus]|uniref:Cellulase family glycosylhydrolase n=1 Tax=Pelagicoccus albus TaxID=415222 RepID=A0A7X1B2N9_9BACT|nr:cellulase family glycosylhydrolase [Pelagicoccus albus]MBC2604544.1 cellulase family glycosylhydrolase [Pelagicoccus albus]